MPLPMALAMAFVNRLVRQACGGSRTLARRFPARRPSLLPARRHQPAYSGVCARPLGGRTHAPRNRTRPLALLSPPRPCAQFSRTETQLLAAALTAPSADLGGRLPRAVQPRVPAHPPARAGDRLQCSFGPLPRVLLPTLVPQALHSMLARANALARLTRLGFRRRAGPGRRTCQAGAVREGRARQAYETDSNAPPPQTRPGSMGAAAPEEALGTRH